MVHKEEKEEFEKEVNPAPPALKEAFEAALFFSCPQPDQTTRTAGSRFLVGK